MFRNLFRKKSVIKKTEPLPKSKQTDQGRIRIVSRLSEKETAESMLSIMINAKANEIVIQKFAKTKIGAIDSAEQAARTLEIFNELTPTTMEGKKIKQKLIANMKEEIDKKFAGGK